MQIEKDVHKVLPQEELRKYIDEFLIDDDKFVRDIDVIEMFCEKLKGKTHDQKMAFVNMNIGNEARTYIIKILALEHLALLLKKESDNFLDLYWKDKAREILGEPKRLDGIMKFFDSCDDVIQINDYKDLLPYRKIVPPKENNGRSGVVKYDFDHKRVMFNYAIDLNYENEEEKLERGYQLKTKIQAGTIISKNLLTCDSILANSFYFQHGIVADRIIVLGDVEGDYIYDCSYLYAKKLKCKTVIVKDINCKQIKVDVLRLNKNATIENLCAEEVKLEKLIREEKK